jgi:signal transduction histidine kinase
MKQLGTKLSLLLLGSLVGTSVLTGILVLRSQTAILTRQIEYDGRALAKTLADLAVERAIANDWLRLRDQIEFAVRGNPQVVFVEAYDDDGTRQAFYPPTADSLRNRSDIRVIENTILVAIDDLPTEVRGKVVLGLNNDRLAELTGSSIRQMVTGTLLTFSFLAILLWIFLRRDVIRPLARLDQHVAVISTGDLTQPIATDREDEIGRLSLALEKMRVNLKQSYTRIQEQVEALKELDRMKDEFLANTSHELKTPLNGIIGLGESLLMGSYGEVSKGLQEPIDLIVACANRLWKMTESILKFSRLHREDIEEQSAPEQHYLSDHLQEAMADLRSNAERAGVNLVLSIPKDFQCVYKRNDLEQVIRILVDNAVKYAPRGVVQVLAQSWDGGPQPGFQIAVRDNGNGIPAELHEKIFEPFVQGFSHETRSQGGVGLGLSIASKLVARMGAKILLQSQVGKGSTFTLLIPEGSVKVDDLGSVFKPWPALSDSLRVWLDKGRPPEAVVTTQPRASIDTSETHILVVDDESVNREVVWQALREEFKVTRAADGASALEVLQREPVDLVLLDIMMPGMSGYEVLQTMAKENLLEKVPVIVLSAKASREAVVKGLELGASDYLGKPFHRAELLCRIRIHLHIKRQRDQLNAEVSAKTNALQIAEHASKVKTQFLANMSHEIRTPLNGILGFLELCLDSTCTPEQLEYLKIMQERTNALLAIVNDIFDLSKIESKDVKTEQVPAVPAEIIQSVVAAFSDEAAKKSLKLEVSCDPGCSGEVLTDPHKLTQILTNLVSNALKFTERGSVRVDGKIQGSAGPGDVALELRVSDTGIGIPRTKWEEVFQPFTQGDGSSTRKYGGTGLGLSICRSYARMLGGDVKVESEPGKGSSFTVTVRARARIPASVCA